MNAMSATVADVPNSIAGYVVVYGMASYGFDNAPPTETQVKTLSLSAEERDYLSFLLYQYGDDRIPETDEWGMWYEQLSNKLDS